MKSKHLFGLFMAGSIALSAVAFAQDKKEDKKPAEGGASGGPDAAMMEAMMKAAKTGEAHARLKALEGKWTFVTKWRMGPEDAWQESTGNAEYKWILGGRLLVQEVKANPSPEDAMMGGPFEGFGLTGYDNVSKEYYNTWNDNMGTGMMSSKGKIDESGKVITYMGSYNDPMTGKEKKVKSVTRMVSADKVVFEMYESPPGGKEYMSLEVTYTRKN